ncbi:MAG: hypothetical protein K0R31_2282, partial [Clostridiales bacterium]|nr:hypothetical protein [Clostridiales bacterium]
KDSNKNVNSNIQTNINVVQEDIQVKIMADFKTLMDSNPKADKVIEFIDKNVSNVSKGNASIMVTGLEERQRKGLPVLEGKYFNGEAIQNKMSKVYKVDFDLNKLDSIQDKEVKDLLTETKDSAYKVETAEGTFFPVINYEYYKKYSTYVNTDIKDYIDIMAVESNKVPAKDAALMIGWDEIINRALIQEKFIKNNASSVKVSDVRQLLKKYFSFMIFGANNTPLFSYETKTIKPEAKTVYLNAVKNNGDSKIIQVLGKYMDLLSKTNYKLNDDVDKFRKSAVESTVF